jgi:hypothetical protein
VATKGSERCGEKKEGETTRIQHSLIISRRRDGRDSLEDLFGAAKVTGGADVGEGEVEAIYVLVTNGAKFELAVLDGETAAVPVVTGLDGAVLDGAEREIEACVGGEG